MDSIFGWKPVGGWKGRRWMVWEGVGRKHPKGVNKCGGHSNGMGWRGGGAHISFAFLPDLSTLLHCELPGVEESLQPSQPSFCLCPLYSISDHFPLDILKSPLTSSITQTAPPPFRQTRLGPESRSKQRREKISNRVSKSRA